MISNRAYKSMRKKIGEGRLDPKFNRASPVAVICAPCVIVEVVVKEASLTSDIPMDWGYCGGRGIVYALGDRAKAREALMLACPQTDLSQRDLFVKIS